MSWGQETVVFFEVDQPFCSRTYSSAPCTAVLGTTGANKCYNNRFTCQDVAHYDPGVLTLRFGYTSGGSDIGTLYGNVLPMLETITVSPASVNVGGADGNMAPLGQRETVAVKLSDAQHSDLFVDKYRTERITGAASSPSVPFDPSQQGTFFGKWLARNPYYASYPAYRARIRRGFVGQDPADMDTRTYAIDRIDVATNGTVTFNLKDIFGQLDDDKTVFPKASLGELSADIAIGATSATLAPAGIGNLNYPASGYVRIEHECMAFTRVGDVLTLTRSALNTTADDHHAQDAVQLVGVFSAQLAHDIVYTLLTGGYTPFLTTDIDKVQWDADAATAGFTNLYTAYVTQPTPVATLIGELSEQAGFSLYPDTSTGKIIFVPLVAGVPPFTVDDAYWIVDGSISVKKQDTKRISQVWVYYGQVDPTQDVSDVNNYRSRYVSVDSNAESPQQYGTSAIHEVFSRWIPILGRASAIDTGDRLLFMFRDPPIEAKFQIHKTRLPLFQPAGLFSLHTFVIQDVLGLPATQTHSITAIKVDDNRAEIKSQQIFLAAPNFNRRIFVDHDFLAPLNIRTEHDKLYSPPSGAETVQLIVSPGVVIGSNTVGDWAVRTGLWPVGTTLQILISAGAELWGMAGQGGDGGDSGFNAFGHVGTFFANDGGPGRNAGPALLAERAVSVTNLGTINGGSPGGGGSGGAEDESGGSHANCVVGGSSGGAGRGPVAAPPGTPGGVWNIGFAGRAQIPPLTLFGDYGTAGTYPAPGVGGGVVTATASNGVDTASSGVAGDGGQPPSLVAQAGAAGTLSSGVGNIGAGGAPGTAGHAVDGNAFITWVAVGTRNGVIA